MAKSRKNRLQKVNSCENTGEIVLSAIKKLMKNTGWTARTIVKFIKMEYSFNDPNLSRKVSRALKRGVRLGLLQTDRGRYRLNDMSALARPVAKKSQYNHRQQEEDEPVRLRSQSTAKVNKRRKRRGS